MARLSDEFSLDNPPPGYPSPLTEAQTRLAAILTPPVPKAVESPENPMLGFAKRILSGEAFQNNPQSQAIADARVPGQATYGGMGGGIVDTTLRSLNVFGSALDAGTITADRVIPDIPAKIAARDINAQGSQGRILAERFDNYRAQGLADDLAANRAMQDYGQALQTYAEDPNQNILGRAAGQGARVLGLAQSITAPAPLPGGASIPFAAGLLRAGAPKIAAAAVAEVAATPGFLKTAEELIQNRSLVGTAAESLRQTAGAQDLATTLSRFDTNVAVLKPGVTRTAGDLVAAGTKTKDDVFREIGTNLDKFDMDQDTKTLILKNADEHFDEVTKLAFSDQRRGVVPVSVMLQTAADKVPGLDLASLSRRPPGSAMNGETLLATGMALNRTASTVKDLLVRVATNGNDEDKARLLLEMTQMNVLQKAFAGGRAEAGRTLRALQEVIKAGKSGRSMYEAAAEAIGGKNQASELLDSLTTLWNRTGIDDTQRDRDIFQFVQNLQKPERGAWIPEVWRNSILSNPITQEINAIGNTLTLVAERGLTRTAAAGIDAVSAWYEGRAREVYFSEILPGIVGALHGAPQGLRQGLSLLVQGNGPGDVSKFIDTGRVGRGEAIGSALGGGMKARVVSGVMNAPTRMLAATDQFFDQMAYTAEIYSQAARAAAKEGLRGRDFATKVAQLKSQPTPEMMNAARDAANLSTLKTEPDKFTAGLLGWRNVKIPGTGIAPLQFVMPFVTTPANLLKLGAAYSPLGVLRALPLEGEARALMLGRAAVGSTIMGAFATQMMQGDRVTAGYPKDPKAKQQFISEGKQPYSIKFGDQWVRFDRFEPITTPLKWTAAMMDAYENGDKDWSKALTSGAIPLAMGRALLDSTYLNGMNSLVNALSDPNANAERWASSIVGGFVPFSGFLRGIAQAGDPYLRDPEGIMEAIQANLPGQSEKVKPQLLITGEPAMRPESRQGIGAAINPLSISVEQKNATLQEINRLRAPNEIGTGGETIEGGPLGLGFPSADIRGMKLTGDEAFNLNQTAQRLALARLDELQASPRYRSATELEKRQLTEKTIAESRMKARGIVADEIVSEAKSPIDIARGAVMRIGTLSAKDDPSGGRTSMGVRADYLSQLQRTGKMSVAVASAVDAARSQPLDGKPEPTVAEYLKLAEVASAYMSEPPYGSKARPQGDSREWAALAEARKRMREFSESDTTPTSRFSDGVSTVLSRFSRVDPQGASLIRKYNNYRTNPVREKLLEANPGLDRLLS